MEQNKTNSKTEKVTSEPKSSVELLEAVITHKANGETREQQKVAVEEIEKSISKQQNLLLEAGTGSGKTLAYLVPAIFLRTRVVVATATKQLSEQIIDIDIPFLSRTINRILPNKKFKATLLKGRENYYCLAKEDEAVKLNKEALTLFGEDNMIESADDNSTSAKGYQIAKEIKELTEWARTTKSGDRSEAPPVSDKVWRQYSSTTAECPGRNICPFASQCFSELARDKAKDAQVVLTNHAVVAHDLANPGESVFGDRDVFIFDEIHELENYLTSAWGTQLGVNKLKDLAKLYRSFKDLKDEDVNDFEKIIKKFNPVVKNIPAGRIEGEHKLLGELLSRIYTIVTRISVIANKFTKDTEENDKKRALASQVSKRSEELLESCKLLMDTSHNTVRWVNIIDETILLNAAPLQVGPRLQEALHDRDATMIGTSATITVGGEFGIPVHNLGFDVSNYPYSTVRLTSPFDYGKQAMIYIPDPEIFPAPVGAERFEHSEAVKKETLQLLKASKGRALILCTTSFAVRELSDFLTKKLPSFHILAQGDAPNSQLISDFTNFEESVLIATMGMWQGVNVEGAACSLVIMDKIPFKPMNDPLAEAQRDWAESQGRNGFMDVFVASAATMLAQGAGRLVRNKTDKGVIAVLDTRLLTKPYGRELLKSLPPAKIFNKLNLVVDALERLVLQMKTNSSSTKRKTEKK